MATTKSIRPQPGGWDGLGDSTHRWEEAHVKSIFTDDIDISNYPMSFYAAGMIAGEYQFRILGSVDGVTWYPIAGPVTFGGPRYVTDGVLNSTTTITSATAAFTTADVGNAIHGRGITAGTTIAGVTNATTATLSETATRTASAVSLKIDGPILADPSLMYRKGRWWVTFTGGDNIDSYHRVSMAYSDDLMTWTMLPVNQRPDTSAVATTAGVSGTWAGEYFIDDDGTVRCYPSVSPDVGGFGGVNNFGIYETHALNDDLTSWSTPVLVFKPSGQSVIDAFVFKTGATYNLLYANKTGSNTYIEWATSNSPTGPFTALRTGNWAGWGNGLEAPSVVKITDTHWRMWFDRYTNQGIFYSDSFDSGLTWSAKTLTDPSPTTGSETLGFSHPTMYKSDSLELDKLLSDARASENSDRILRPYAAPFGDVLTIRPNFPPLFISRSRRATVSIADWVFGQDLYSLGDYDSWVLHHFGMDAVVFNTTTGAGFARFGPATGLATNKPYFISLGTTLSDTPGINPKLVLQTDNGFNPTGGNYYGFGVSGTRLDYMVPANCAHAFYIGGQIMASITREQSVAGLTELSLGGIYSDTSGAKPKLKVYDDGVRVYGIGASHQGGIRRMDYMAPVGEAHAFYAGGVLLAGISALNGLAIEGPTPQLRIGPNKVIGARDTGWTAMTGTGSKAALAAAPAGTASGTYTQAEVQGLMDRIAALEARMKAYDDAWFTHGLIGT